MKKVCAVLLTVVLLCGAAASMADGLWTCPECGKKSGANFCPWCGAKKPRDKVVCGDCGAEYPADAGSSFCANCEARLPGGEAPAAKEYATGDIVTQGRYEQDNSFFNGPEPIEWLVLDVQDGRALLISKYGLDAKPYNKELTDTTWERSSLRIWLNDYFLNKAFTISERDVILLTDVDNSDSQRYSDWSKKWNAIGGNDTQDYIFLLSCREAFQYFNVTKENNENIASRISPTAYARAQGAYVTKDYLAGDGKPAAAYWTLRSPGIFQNDAAFVINDGALASYYVVNSLACVRPALWVNLDSGIFNLES